MASNYDDALDQMRALGLVVDSIETGSMRRCRVEGDREKRGWFFLHDMRLPDGDDLVVGTFGIWRGDDSQTQKIELRKRDKALSAEQRDAIKRRMADDRKRIAAERAQQAEAASRRAGAMWLRYAVDGQSDYLAAKSVQAFGLRFTPGNSAVVPLLDTHGKVHGLQFLRTAKQAEIAKRPAKEFWPAGVAKKAHFHLLGTPQWIVVVCEGYATGATVHMATGYPVAIAFDAGNIGPVAAALRKRYRNLRVLVAADDDSLQKCRECGARVLLAVDPVDCPACGKPHHAENAGRANADATALETNGAWVAPEFADEAGRREQFIKTGRKLTDFNDLHVAEGLHVVRSQIEARITALSWAPRAPKNVATQQEGAGGRQKLSPFVSTDELLTRFPLVYAHSGAVFDRNEHIIMSITDMQHACIRRDVYKGWAESPQREIVRVRDIGFDPGGDDPSITCNLWGGWPTQPKPGKCDRLLEMLQHMCSGDSDPRTLFSWIIRWLAYPIQHPGAKMQSTIVVHGPQGTGKNLFFETIMDIYGEYADVIDQAAVDDNFNDWASRKLFMIADEVIAQAEKFQIKNRLKTVITGRRIRINSKMIAAYWESNHLNLVFLSNETMPVVLEEGDRRHCIIWTPAKRAQTFYAEVIQEIGNGGAAALHDYLLSVDLGDFTTGTLPPYTQAKERLIEQSWDSPTRFFYDLTEEQVGPLRAIPARTEHVFDAYRTWCNHGAYRPAPLSRFVSALTLRHHVPNLRKRYNRAGDLVGPHGVLMLGKAEPPAGMHEADWLGQCIADFRGQLNDYKGMTT